MKKIAKKINNLAKEHHHIIQNVMDKKLSKRMKMYLIITCIILLIESYELIVSGYSISKSLLFLLWGIGIGFMASRMFYLTWDADEEVITSRIDTVGVIVLILYIWFSVMRNTILKEIVGSSAVLVVTFAIVSGMMIGRFIGLQYKAYKLFKKYS